MLANYILKIWAEIATFNEIFCLEGIRCKILQSLRGVKEEEEEKKNLSRIERTQKKKCPQYSIFFMIRKVHFHIFEIYKKRIFIFL
jgi:hypothetical protein